MRTVLSGEVALAQDYSADYYVRLEVQNGSGTWIDVGALLGNHWIINATWGETRDIAVSQATFVLVMRVGSASLAPLMTGSALNVDDTMAYSPLLQIGRLVRASTATMPHLVALDVTKYRPVFTGRIDDVVGVDSIYANGPITITCFDLGAWLMDLQIEKQGKSYGDLVTPPALETVLQNVINDYIPVGEPAVTLVKESSSSFAVTGWVQGETKLLESLITLVLDSTGEDIRYRFDASHVSQLMWFNPDRGRVTVDATFANYTIQKLDLSIKDIRNAGEMGYTDSATLMGGIVSATDPTSIANYRRRFVRVPASKMLTTVTESQAVINAVINDLSGAPAEATVSLPFCWFVQLYDRYTFSAPSQQYDQDQTFVVGGYQHSIESGKGSTTLTPCTARIVGAYAAWQRRLGGPGPATPPPPKPPSVTHSFDWHGQLILNVIGDEKTVSLKYAISSVSLPTATTVRATTAILQQSITGILTGIYVQPGHSVYVAAFAYSASGSESNPMVAAVLPRQGGALDAPYLLPGHIITEEAVRGGDGGIGTPGGPIRATTLFDNTGSTPLIDTILRRFQTALGGPTGIGGDIIERGGNKGDNAIDSGFVAITTAIDFVRAYLNKHLGNVPDDGTSDRRAATLNQKTGGDRGFGAIDSGNLIVSAAIDFVRSFVNKHLGNIPDDGTSDRRAATLNQKTGGDRGFGAIDSGNLVIAAAVDFARSFVNKHLGNIPDDGTSDRRAVSLVQKNAATRADTALDGSSKLQTGVTAAATAADGNAGIESQKTATQKSARAAGTGAQGITEEEATRGSAGGYGAPGARYRSEPGFDATGSVPTWDPLLRRHYNSTQDSTVVLDNTTGVIGAGTSQALAGTARALTKGYQSGFVQDAGAVTFSPVYQNVPAIRLTGGLGPNATFPYDDISAAAATASGFTCHARIKNKGTATARTAEFTASLTDSAPGDVTGNATLASAPDIADNYKARYKIAVTCTTIGGAPSGTNTVVVAIEVSANGSTGWTEYATRSYAVSRTTAGTTTTTFSAQEVTVNVAGLLGASSPAIRLKYKSQTDTGGSIAGSAVITGYSNAGSDGHGVLYSTATGSTNTSKTPAADDFMLWEAWEVIS